jgi:hypothetical protein
VVKILLENMRRGDGKMGWELRMRLKILSSTYREAAGVREFVAMSKFDWYEV